MLTVNLSVSVWDKTPIETLAAQKIGAPIVEKCVILKKSVDARKKDNVLYTYRVAVEVKNERKYIRKDVEPYHMNVCTLENTFRSAHPPARPVVIGSGPSGLFVALSLIYAGAKPVVIERGDDVDKRSEKVARFIKTLTLDTESNVQFGEGGAGTFSDGKLTTGVHNEYIEAVLREFVKMGAPEEILYLNKPHIGTDILKDVVKNIRLFIEERGGKFCFNTKMTGLKIVDGKVVSIETNRGDLDTDAAYLCIGHSARDTFEMLYKKGVKMESKTFSMGVRIEHLRENINFAQYGKSATVMPAADYKTAVDIGNNKSLYTFCMCPGGRVINASSEEGGVTVNGMSYHARNDVNSNSALLVNVTKDDWKSEDALAGVAFQRHYERKAFEYSRSYKPVCQTVGDFLSGKSGSAFTDVQPSVETGFVKGDLNEILPKSVADGLKTGLPLIGRRINGFDGESAALTGIEGRSSSPVRILRDEKGVSSVERLYPVGEGAGYAGGIMSAATDGVKAVLKSSLF